MQVFSSGAGIVMFKRRASIYKKAAIILFLNILLLSV